MGNHVRAKTGQELVDLIRAKPDVEGSRRPGLCSKIARIVAIAEL
jgi:hypothetical protein